MDPRTKNDSDKTQDIRMPYLGNTFDREWTQQVVKQKPYAAEQNLTFWPLHPAQMSFC